MCTTSTFDRVYQQYRPVVTAAILRYSRGWVRSEDLLDLEQEVWARVWRALQSPTAAYDPQRGAWTTYLYLITHSVCCNAFAKNRRDPSNQALRLEVRSSGAPLAVSAARIPALRDEAAEARLLTADTLARFRAIAARSEDAAALLHFYAACAATSEATDRRVAKEMGVTLRVVQQARERAKTLLATLGVA
jgi:DNA-directed RNA polymerase specialized sigma24 family protein